MHSFPRGVLWRWPWWYAAVRYVALLPRWVHELYCNTTYNTLHTRKVSTCQISTQATVPREWCITKYKVYMQPHEHTAVTRYYNITQIITYHTTTTKWYCNLIILQTCNFNHLCYLANFRFWNSLRMIQRCQNMQEWALYKEKIMWYTECPRRNVPDFGRVFLMLKYTDITQNTYVQSWTVTEIMAREVWNFDSCYTLIDYQIHIKTGRNMWLL